MLVYETATKELPPVELAELAQFLRGLPTVPRGVRGRELDGAWSRFTLNCRTRTAVIHQLLEDGEQPG